MSEKKKKTINAAVCDAREVKEESLSGFESITINAALLIANERSKELLSRYPVSMNVASTIEVPDSQDISVRIVNGKHEIGPDADGTGVFLIVNGRLTIESGSLEAVKSYYRIMVNGKVLMPRSYRGQLTNISENGKCEYYPDGAVILKANAEIDDLFIARAASRVYHCPGTLFILDDGLDAEKLIEKDIRFSAKRIVAAEGLIEKLISRFDEESELIRVPNGVRLISGDLELNPRTLKKFGSKLLVCGDVSIMDETALNGLEYLFTSGTLSINKNLEAEFDEIESVYSARRVIDPEAGYISDRPSVKIGASILKKHPNGLYIEDCAAVRLSADISPDTIMDKLHITDCALISCTEEQEEAVHMIAKDVATIRVSDANGEDDSDSFPKSLFGAGDTLLVNAAEYKM